MATGDFNNDGFEDLVVAWAIFPHTIEESQKIDAPINVYLNDGYGHLLKILLSIHQESIQRIHLPIGWQLQTLMVTALMIFLQALWVNRLG